MTNKTTKVQAITVGITLALLAACESEAQRASVAPAPEAHEAERTAAPEQVAARPRAPEPAATKVKEPAPQPTFAELMASAREARKAGDRARARSLYLAAAKLEPKRARPQVQAARLLIEARELKQARELAEVGVALESGWSLAWNTLGRVDLAEGKLAAAEDAFAEAVKCDEDNIYAWNNLGLVRIKRKRFAEAVEALKHATVADAARAYMFNNLGLAYEGLARTQEALGAYKSGLVLGSGIAGQNYVRLERAQQAPFGG